MNRGKLLRWASYLLVSVILVSLLWSYTTTPQPDAEISISELARDVQAGVVQSIEVDSDGRQLVATYEDQTTRRSQTSDVSSLEEVLSAYGIDESVYFEQGIEVTYERPPRFGGIGTFALTLLPVGLLIAFFYFMMVRQGQAGGNQALSFGKSKARMFTGENPTITFADVAGVDEAKEELGEVVEFLREPDKYVSFGARIPKGVLLVGPPGTGKTLLAKAVSGEAGVPFFSIAGSEFVEMFVGVGASRVRDLFETAKRHSPCIIFIDEIDAVGRQRGAGLGGGHDEREQTLNQILVEMDGFSSDTHIIILAATNRPDILDPALLRPGRFDRRVTIDRPDVKGREHIFTVHMRGKPVSKRVEVEVLAKATPGFSGADIENTVNEAALLAARRNRPNIAMPEFHEAIERVQLGPERRSRIMTQEDKEITAWHEAGHALVAQMLPHAHPVRKVTIVPRGPAGGVTWFLEDDHQYLTTERCHAMIAVALGGRVAEEIVFGDVTTGASSDLQRVTKIARAMVTQYGMSTDLGLRTYGERQEMVFLGKEISEQRDYSDAIAEQIDGEIRAIIDRGHKLATEILTENRETLDLVANTLLEIETLDMDQFKTLVETGQLPPEKPKGNAPYRQPMIPDGEVDSADQGSELDLPPSPAPA